MEKRMFVGVRRKRPIKRHKKKLLHRVLHYLTSKSYMFGPLTSRSPSGFSSNLKKRASIRRTGLEVQKPIREKERLLKKLGDYLKSNSYMYAPLLASPQSIVSPPKGSSLYLERVTTVEVSEQRLILKGYKPREMLEDVTIKERTSKGSLPEKLKLKQQSLVPKETVNGKETTKHAVHNSCRSSSMPGRGIRGIRELVDFK